MSSVAEGVHPGLRELVIWNIYIYIGFIYRVYIGFIYIYIGFIYIYI